MINNPYDNASGYQFWKEGVSNSDPGNLKDIHVPRWGINKEDNIVTIGSCFAQHIANWLRERKFNVPFYDTEENIKSLSFSANYGNVYTVRQALQLVNEASKFGTIRKIGWKKEGGYIDAIRPNVFENPFATEDELWVARSNHISGVAEMIDKMDVLIFTLGLTETWNHKKSGTILPSPPGVIAGSYDEKEYEFINFSYPDVISDLDELCENLISMRNGRPFKLLLTVSPVPLTATAENRHVLQSSIYSKSILRAVAGDFCSRNDFADYFPSFEIINNPAARSMFFNENLRSVKDAGVMVVMSAFKRSYFEVDQQEVEEVGLADPGDPVCDDALLEFLSEHPSKRTIKHIDGDLLLYGNSHTRGVLTAIQSVFPALKINYTIRKWLKNSPIKEIEEEKLRTFIHSERVSDRISDFKDIGSKVLVLVGQGLYGDGILRVHGSLAGGGAPEMKIISEVGEDTISFYDQYTLALAKQAKLIDKFTDFDYVFWIAGPDMIESAARLRLGDEFVDSGSIKLYRDAFDTCLKRHLKGIGRVQVITHSWQDLCEESGFTANRFKFSDVSHDIHVNHDYYEGAVMKIKRLINK